MFRAIRSLPRFARHAIAPAAVEVRRSACCPSGRLRRLQAGRAWPLVEHRSDGQMPTTDHRRTRQALTANCGGSWRSAFTADFAHGDERADSSSTLAAFNGTATWGRRGDFPRIAPGPIQFQKAPRPPKIKPLSGPRRFDIASEKPKTSIRSGQPDSAARTSAPGKDRQVQHADQGRTSPSRLSELPMLPGSLQNKSAKSHSQDLDSPDHRDMRIQIVGTPATRHSDYRQRRISGTSCSHGRDPSAGCRTRSASARRR